MAVENRFAHDRWEKRDGDSAGTVSEIRVKPGDSVGAGDVVVVIG